MNKKITTISISALILGLFTQMIPMFAFTPYQWITRLVKIVRVLSPNINLSYISDRLYTYHNFKTGFEINFLDLSVYALILFGTIFYLKSRGKEIRLLRFTFSIILLTKVLSVFSFVISIIFYGKFLQGESFYVVLNILSITADIVWLLTSYIVIKMLSQKIGLIKHKTKENLTDYVDSPKAQRFLHHILDLILSITICSRLVIFFFREFLGQIEDVFGERAAMYFVIIVSHLIYLVLFELVFKATPAKLLTGSRVVMASDDKITIKTVFLRSISRHVPFEAFSYLGEGNGWHDKWLKTRVVKEENFGVPVKKYLWIIAIFAVKGILSYVGHEAKDRYDSYQWKKNKYNNKIENIEASLNVLSTDYFFEINDVRDKYETGHDTYYLKVDSINQKFVTFKYFKMEDYSPSIYEIEKYYENNKIKIPSTRILKKELNMSYTDDYGDFKDMKRDGLNFIPESEKKYFISESFCAYKPNITLLTTGGYGQGYISIELGNDGWPAELIDIKNIEGNLNWTNELPQKVKSKVHYSDRGIILRAENFEYGQPYKFQITLLDSIGRIEEYLIEGVNSERIMKLIDGEE